MKEIKAIKGKMRIFKISIVVMATLMLLGLASCGKQENVYAPPKEEQRLVVYTSHKAAVYDAIIQEFEERTGIWVEVVTGGTTELLDSIAKGNTGADVMFGGGVDSLSVYAENFMSYVSSQSENLTSEYSSEDGVYTVFSKLPIVFVYNKKLLNAAAAPRSWEELLDYRWKGKIAFASPKVSGSSYTAVSAMVQILNPRLETDEILRRFTSNLNGNESSGSGAVVSDVISGKRTIGIALEDVVKKAMETNADLAIIYPKEGTPVLPDGCAIVKDAPHTDNAVLFIEFCVSEDVQHYLEENLYRYSVRTDLAKPIPCSEYYYNLEEAENLRDLIFTTWEQEVEK